MKLPLSLESLFLGAVTVGERGQVVIPAEARREFGIESGDKLFVFRHPEGIAISFVKLETLTEFIEKAMETITQLRSKVEKKKSSKGG